MVTIKISIARLVRLCNENANYTFSSPLGENLRVIPAPNSFVRCNVIDDQAASRTLEIYD
jgi:hypothetical protein